MTTSEVIARLINPLAWESYDALIAHKDTPKIEEYFARVANDLVRSSLEAAKRIENETILLRK